MHAACRPEWVPLVLTQHLAQRDAIAELIGKEVANEPILLTSRPDAKLGHRLEEEFPAPLPKRGRIVLATGRLVGEGFDLPRLDALFLAAPHRLAQCGIAIRSPFTSYQSWHHRHRLR